MENMTKEQLIKQYKEMRMYFFNTVEEDLVKFEKHYGEHLLYEIVVKHFDESFTKVNQLANEEIDKLLSTISTQMN